MIDAPPSRRRGPVFGFLCRFALFYGLLVLPWPGFRELYGRHFRTLGQLVYATEQGPRILRVLPASKEVQPPLDTQIVLANRELFDKNGLGPARILALDSRAIGWIPSALLISLVLATPVSWKRRTRALLAGLVFIHGVILLSIGVYVWNNSDEHFGFHALAVGTFAKWIAAALEETLITQMGPSFAIPVLVWSVAIFHREDTMP